LGWCSGSGAGGLDLIFDNHDVLRERGPRRVSPTLIANMIPDAASGYIAIQLGAQGPNMAVVAACSTGGHNIGEAYELIRRGDAAVVIAGGSEAPIHPTIVASFSNMRGLAEDNLHPERACKPFDARRDGFILSEGAGALVLESLEHALARGAPIIAEIVGYGNSCDAGDMIAADDQGARRGARDDDGIAQIRLAARCGRLYQCPRHRDAAQRSCRNPCDQVGFWGSCVPSGGQFHQIDAGSHDGRSRCSRGADLRACHS
jgi:3-oxoacyl-(acyl-carrier-protein) synthase